MESEEEHPQRAAFRFTLPCQVSYPVGGKTAQASLLDVSLEGVSVSGASECPPVGTEARVRLHLGEDEEPIDVDVEVVRHLENGFAGRFVNLSGESAIALWDRIAAVAKSKIRSVIDG